MSTATICDKCQKTISIGNQNQSQIINLEKSAFIGGQHEYFHICPACYKSLKEWLADKAQSGEIAIKPEVSAGLIKAAEFIKGERSHTEKGEFDMLGKLKLDTDMLEKDCAEAVQEAMQKFFDGVPQNLAKYCKFEHEKQPESAKYVSELSLDTIPLKNAIEGLNRFIREKGDMLNQLTAHGATLTININGGLLTVDGVAAKLSGNERG